MSIRTTHTESFFRINLGAFAVILSLVVLLASVYNGVVGVAFAVAGVAVLIVFRPWIALAIFLGAFFWPWRPSDALLLWLTDWLALLLILGWLLTHALSGSSKITFTGIEGVVLLFLGSLALSLKNTWDFNLGFKAWAHNVFYFLTFFVLYQRIRLLSLEKLVKLYCLLAASFNVLAVIVLFRTGGSVRGFGGMSGFGYTDLVLPVLFFGLAYYFFSPRGEKKWITLVFWILLGILSSQSRNAFIGLVFGTAFLVMVALSRGRFDPHQAQIRRRLFGAITVIVLVGIILLSFLPSYLPSVGKRLSELSESRPGGTIAARLMLWGLALKAFSNHPLTGIGFNQFERIIDIFPELKNLTFYLWFRGISVHNVFLSILVESGLVGALSFMLFQIVCLRKAWHAFLLATEWEEKAFGLGLLTTIFFITVSSYYGWQWFWWTNAYEYMFFLAVLMVYSGRLKGAYES